MKKCPEARVEELEQKESGRYGAASGHQDLASDLRLRAGVLGVHGWVAPARATGWCMTTHWNGAWWTVRLERKA